MTVHLIKLAVGIDSFSHLVERQAFRLAEAAGTDEPRLRHLTRSTPRRAEEILDGGSIYWVIKRAIRARLRFVDIDRAVNHKGVQRCALILDPGSYRFAHVRAGHFRVGAIWSRKTRPSMLSEFVTMQTNCQRKWLRNCANWGFSSRGRQPLSSFCSFTFGSASSDALKVLPDIIMRRVKRRSRGLLIAAAPSSLPSFR